ncbi:MAG: hypothetical protein IKI65_05290 [Firmicutes bacterium]|nr:hypothetical protein [Bacillota bacterium]
MTDLEKYELFRKHIINNKELQVAEQRGEIEGEKRGEEKFAKKVAKAFGLSIEEVYEKANAVQN